MTAPRRFIFCPVGSAGDVFPFMAVARALKRRGEEISFVAHEHFEELARREGFAFTTLGEEGDFESVAENPDLWHPRRGFAVIMSVLERWLRPAYAHLEATVDPERDVLVLHALCFWGRVHQEVHGTAGTTLHLAPSAFRSLDEMPALAPGRTINGAPRFLKRALWWFVDHLFLDRVIRPHLDPWRRELGLPPVRRVFKDWYHGRDGVITLFPEWFGERQDDWPENFDSAGFPIFDGAEDRIGPELDAWLDQGSPPIVVTPGSANVMSEAMVRVVVEAAKELDRRVLVLAQRADGTEGSDPARVRHETWAPLGLVTRRAALLVHHGGIGSTARGIHAGRPQLVLPMGFDQPDNATRVQRLGLGDFLATKDLKAGKVARKIRAMLDSETMSERCRDFASRIDGEAAERAAEFLLRRHPKDGTAAAKMRGEDSGSGL